MALSNKLDKILFSYIIIPNYTEKARIIQKILVDDKVVNLV